MVHKDPFQTLQDVLPHSVGVGLARKWILCGGKCFFGGSKVANDQLLVRQGNFDFFLTHVEESCL